MGKFLTDKSVNFNAMKNRMATLWQPGRGLCIKAIGSNLFLFQFYHEIDLRRVIEGGVLGCSTHVYYWCIGCNLDRVHTRLNYFMQI